MIKNYISFLVLILTSALAMSQEQCPSGNLNLVSAKYVNGSRAMNAAENAIIMYDNTLRGIGQSAVPTQVASVGEVGAVWSLAWNPNTQKLYAAAFLKRHTDLSPDGLGAIYEIDLADQSNPGTPTLWLDVNSSTYLGGGTLFPPDPGAGTRGLGARGAPSQDNWAWLKVGKEGLGDIEFSEDYTKMYVMDLTNQQMLIIDVATKGSLGQVAVPNPGCAGGVDDVRPFAIKAANSEIYIGVVCSGETNDTHTEIGAFIYRADNATTPTTFNQEINFNLTNLPKQTNQWFSWSKDINDVYWGGTWDFTFRAAPLISDIEFDQAGNMVIGIMDRTGHQAGTNNSKPDALTSDVNYISVGDVTRATPMWIPEAQPHSFYYMQATGGGDPLDSFVGGVVTNNCLGTDYVIAHMMDPYQTVTNGTTWLEAANGNQQGSSIATGRVELTPPLNSPDYFGKAGGLGDLEVLMASSCTTPAAPIVSITDNDCGAGTTGTINIDTPCAAGSHIEYSVDGGVTWSTTQPTYSSSAFTFLSRCVDDSDANCFSSDDSDATNPTVCPPQPPPPGPPVPNCPTPQLASSIFSTGNPLGGGTAGEKAAFAVFDYDAQGVPADINAPGDTIRNSAIGATWGLAYSKTRNCLYSSAFFKRHCGFGPLGIDGIYKIDLNGVAPSVQPFVELNDDLGVDVGADTRTPSIGAVDDPNELPINSNEANWDVDAYDAVGKRSMGDLDISLDENELYVVNLWEKTLVALDISGTNPTLINEYNFPDPGCSNGEFRPFALKVHIDDAGNEAVYVGIVCSEQTSQSIPDLHAYIYSFNPATAIFTPVYDFSLGDFTRCCVHGGTDASWQPWHSVWESKRGDERIIWPQPILSDIEFDIDGSMILGFMDRQGHQSGASNYRNDPSSTVLWETMAAGDIMRVCNNGGTYELENNGNCPGGSVTNGSNGSGPGGGEYYWGDHALSYDPGDPQDGNHDEIVVGGIAFLPGSGEINVNVYDPDDQARTGGVIKLSNTTGGRPVGDEDGYRLYPSQNPDFLGKANGLGDLELLCASTCTNPSPPVVSITDNVCPSTTGTINIDTPCAAGSHIEYSTDGGVNWTTTQPTYGSSSITILSRCIDDIDPTCFSTSDSDSTNPTDCGTCANGGCINWGSLGFADFTTGSSDPNNLDQTFNNVDGNGTDLDVHFSDFGRWTTNSQDLTQNFGVISSYSCNTGGDILRYWEPLQGVADTVQMSFSQPISLSSLYVGGYRDLASSAGNNGIMQVLVYDGPNCTGNLVAPNYADPNLSAVVDVDAADPLPTNTPIVEFTGNHTGADGSTLEPIGDQDIMWCGNHYELVGLDSNRPWAMLDYGDVVVQSICYITYTQDSTSPCDATANLVDANNSVYMGPIQFCPASSCSITNPGVVSTDCTTPGTIFFTLNPQGGTSATYTISSSSGTVSPSSGSFGQGTKFALTGYSGSNATITITDSSDSSCSETFDIDLTTCNYTCASCSPVCTIIIDGVSASACDPNTNTYDLDVTVEYVDPASGDIQIDVAGVSQTFTPDGSGMETFTVTGLPVDGSTDIDVSASFVNDGTCRFTGVDLYDAPSCTDPCNNPQCTQNNEYFLCSNGTDSIDLSVEAGATNIMWYDGDGNFLGSGTTMTFTNSDIGNGTAGESQCFYYTADDAATCSGYTCCPVILTVEDCCPNNNCFGIQIINN